MTYTFVLAPDSFKESLTAKEVCQAMEKGVRAVFPDANVLHAPMADGGEGSTESVVDATGGELLTHTVTGPLGEEVVAAIGLHGQEDSAFIEMASASGLHLVPKDQRNPLKTTTYGTGQLILKCLEMGIYDIMIGIGGSATNDGGMGMAQALGYRFLDENSVELDGGGDQLEKIARINSSKVHHDLAKARITIACDVDDPLIGPQGASAIFGPQKGADSEMVNFLDKSLAHFAEVLERDLDQDVKDIPGAGAAGGLGAGLLAFTNAELKRGIDVISETTSLADKLAGADVVLTGEGQMNHQTKYGKTPYGVLQVARDLAPDAKVIAVAGSINGDISDLYELGFDSIFSTIPELMELEDLYDQAATNVSRVTEAVCRVLKK